MTPAARVPVTIWPRRTNLPIKASSPSVDIGEVPSDQLTWRRCPIGETCEPPGSYHGRLGR
jgi:hypothetical protein